MTAGPLSDRRAPTGFDMGHNPSIRGLQAVCFKCQGLVLIPGAVRSASATGLWHRAPAGVPEDPSVPLSHASCRACLWLTAPGSRGAFPAGLAPSCTLELLKPFGSIRPRSPWQTITFWLLLLGSCCVVTEPARCPGWVDALTMSPRAGLATALAAFPGKGGRVVKPGLCDTFMKPMFPVVTPMDFLWLDWQIFTFSPQFPQ